MLTIPPVPGALVVYLGRNMRVMKISDEEVILRTPLGSLLSVTVTALCSYGHPYTDPCTLPPPVKVKKKAYKVSERKPDRRVVRSKMTRYTSEPIEVTCIGCGAKFETYDKQKVRCVTNCTRRKTSDKNSVREFNCGICDKYVATRQPHMKYCSSQCRQKAYNSKRRAPVVRPITWGALPQTPVRQLA